MFKFLKDKLKDAVGIFSKKVEEEAEVEEQQGQPEDVIDEQPAKAEQFSEEPAKAEQLAEEPAKAEELEEAKQEEEIEIPQEPEEKPEPEVFSSQASEPGPPEVAEEQASEEPRAQENEDDFSEEQFEESRIAEIDILEKEAKEIEEKIAETEKPKTSFLGRLFGKKEKPKEGEPEEIPQRPEQAEAVSSSTQAPVAEEPITDSESQESKGLFSKLKETLTTVKLSDEKFEKLFWDLELAMLENNVAVEVIEKIKEDLRVELTTGKVSRKGIDELVEDSLKKSVEELFAVGSFDIVERIRSKPSKPFVISFIGVNGSGKTTTMAKIAHKLLKNKLSVVFAASDTFRAAAIQQLQEHADKLGVKMIRHDYESDPAAVAFDAIKHAQAKGIDVVLIDTAGRLHTNDNLMNELKKLIRVNKPDLKIFIGESITGNDCVEQAKLFDEAVGIDGIILAKADIDEKGGAALSVSYVTKKPILYIGTGQTYDDLVEFKPELVTKNIGL